MIAMTCNKKGYPEFREECNKCPMMVECVINGKSVAVGMLECPSVNVTVNINGASDGVSIDKIIDRINKNLKITFGGD